MKGVACDVDAHLKLYDLTHEIPAYNVWEAAYRLHQTAVYWPAGTVFVSVVDPGVGTTRASIVAKSKSGHYFVTPDNGTLTLVADALGLEAVRLINETVNRRHGSSDAAPAKRLQPRNGVTSPSSWPNWATTTARLPLCRRSYGCIRTAISF